MKSKTRFKWKRQLALLCLGALCLGGCARRAAPQEEAEGPETVIEFPAEAAGEAVSVSFGLPEGWTARAREADAGRVTAEQQRDIAASVEFTA